LSRFTPFARLAIVLVLVGAFLLGSAMVPTEAGAARATRQDVVNWVYQYAAYYGVNAQVLLAVGQCESGLQPYGPDGRSGEMGPFQFHPRGIWRQTPYAWMGYSPRDPQANVAAAAWAFSRGYQSHWSCYRMVRYR
jgi:hypothetical protein